MGKITRRVATDVGGTFTDLVCFETDTETGASRVITAKTDTTPPVSPSDRADSKPQVSSSSHIFVPDGNCSIEPPRYSYASRCPVSQPAIRGSTLCR